MAEALLMDLLSQRSTAMFSTAQHTLHHWLLTEWMALNSLICADVPLRNCSLTHWLPTERHWNITYSCLRKHVLHIISNYKQGEALSGLLHYRVYCRSCSEALLAQAQYTVSAQKWRSLQKSKPNCCYIMHLCCTAWVLTSQQHWRHLVLRLGSQ